LTVRDDRAPLASCATTVMRTSRAGRFRENENGAAPDTARDRAVTPSTSTRTRVVPAKTRPETWPKEASRGAGETIAGGRRAALATTAGGSSTESAMGIT
jgi:hypothetical protein